MWGLWGLRTWIVLMMGPGLQSRSHALPTFVSRFQAVPEGTPQQPAGMQHDIWTSVTATWGLSESDSLVSSCLTLNTLGEENRS